MKRQDSVLLEDVQQIHNLTIKRRYGRAVRRERLPLYTVWTPDGRCLEEFRRLASAIKWCVATCDFDAVHIARAVANTAQEFGL